MQFSLSDSLPILQRTPGVVRAILQFLPEAWTHRDYGVNADGSPTWSAHEIVAHLIFGEQTDWIPRARHILEFGETRPIPPFDRAGHRALMQGKTLRSLLDEFEQARRDSLATLAKWNLSDADLAKCGTHPKLGRVTLAQLLATWTVHDLNHIAQINKAMAYQYQGEVGAWEAYLSILRPPEPR